MLLIERFAKNKLKLKGFFTQVKIWIDNKGFKLLTPIKKIVYAGMYLTRKLLEWFQFYLVETQVNKNTSINNKIQYMFST